MKNGLVISLDFELFWGSTDTMVISAKQVEKYRTTRKAIPKLLKLFTKYNISCTWSTVGFLFARDQNEIFELYSDSTPNYKDKNLSTYERLKLIDARYNDCYFAPNLIQEILDTSNQELSTHTFSHYFAIDAQGDEKAFAEELRKAQLISKVNFNTKLKSIVYPRNQICNTDILASHDIFVYRGDSVSKAKAYQRGTTLQGRNKWNRLYRLADRYFPFTRDLDFDINEVQSQDGVINVPASRFLAPMIGKLSWLENVRLARIKKEMTSAAINSKSYHLWWHPHNMAYNSDLYLSFLEKILIHFEDLSSKYNWHSYSMASIKNSGNENTR